MSSQRQSPAHVHVQFHRSDRSTQQQRRIRWQRVHRDLIPRLISHAQIRWAPVLAQLVFICSRRLWLFQPPLQYSALADLQLFIKAFFFFVFWKKGHEWRRWTWWRGEGRRRCHVYFLALMDSSIVATAVTLRGNNSAALKGDMFPFKGD